MDHDGGGWTVIIRRDDIEPREDFYRNWDAYKWGFGDLKKEFYWGNEYIWMMTSDPERHYQAHFWLKDWENATRYAVYDNFTIESEADNFRLSIGEYSGSAGDSFYYNNNHPFSTFDRDTSYSGTCAESREAAWWYNYCTYCQLTGTYYEGGYSGYAEHGIVWRAWKNTDPYSMQAAVMKIRPSDKS